MSSTSKSVVGVVSCGLLLGGFVAAPPASAAVPSNDNRADATRLALPAEVTGSLVDATLEPTNDSSNCGSTDASVWYRFKAPKRGAVIIQLDAGGEMDATVDLYQQVRSKQRFTDCSETNNKGVATIDTEGLEAGADYTVRVGRQTGSVAAGFSLRVLVPSPPPEPPGKPLPAKGVRNSVDRLLNPGDAYWTRMEEGRTMRLSLRVNQCTRLDVYGPGTSSFGGSMLKSLGCGGFSLFTPTETGRYFLVVRAGRSRDKQPYRLRVAPARRDDTTPGIFIGNNAKVRGRVNGGIDSRDLYRFDVTRRSTLTLTVTGRPLLRLVRDDGRRIGRGDYIERNVAPGRYYVAVQGEGKYTLKRVSRTITKSAVTFNGRRKATTRPGSTTRLSLRVRPSVSGRGVMTLERLDPIDGWQFLRRYRVNVTAGSATVSFRPPSVGRYRVTGDYKGSRIAAASYAGTARLKVQGPLVD
ncbi:MAG: hypothetical protein R2687_00560 [Candidatus Nanopelagicales bacterium]